MKNKNSLIIALLAVVLVMAVGYAAFSTSLTINGTATTSSTWNVHLDHTTSGYNTAYSITPATGYTLTASEASPTMTVTDSTATLTTNLKQPGDSVTFTLTVKNEGSLPAKLSSYTLKVKLTGTGSTESSYRDENSTDAIIYSVSGLTVNSTIAAGSSTTFTVTATYRAGVASQPTSAQLSKSAQVTLNYVQG